MIARKYGFDRETLDRVRAAAAIGMPRPATDAGAFADEIVPVMVDGAPHLKDEGIRYDAIAREHRFRAGC